MPAFTWVHPHAIYWHLELKTYIIELTYTFYWRLLHKSRSTNTCCSYRVQSPSANALRTRTQHLSFKRKELCPVSLSIHWQRTSCQTHSFGASRNRTELRGMQQLIAYLRAEDLKSSIARCAHPPVESVIAQGSPRRAPCDPSSSALSSQRWSVDMLVGCIF